MNSEENSQPKAEALVSGRDELYAAESDTKERYLSEAGSSNTLNADVLGASASSGLGYNSLLYNNQMQQQQLLRQQLRRQQLLRQQQQLNYMTGNNGLTGSGLTGSRNNLQMQQRMTLAGNRRMVALAPNNMYGNIDRQGYGGGNAGGFLNGISFLSGDFDVGIDGDLLLAGIAAAAAAFFYAVYGAITTGRKKRSDPSSFGFFTNWLSGLFGPALEAVGVTGDGEEVLNRIANSVVNPKPQWLQPDKSDDKGMP